MLRKADEHLATQRQFEAETQAKLSSARQRRQEEKERQEALEVSTRFRVCLDFSHHHNSEIGWKNCDNKRRS